MNNSSAASGGARGASPQAGILTPGVPSSQEPGASRSPATVSRSLQLRLENVPQGIQAMSWKAQVRLCNRYRRLMARGKQVNQVVVAIAREIAAFVWAIAREVAVAH